MKLTATYLNGVAIATIAVGGLAPVVALASGTVQPAALTLIAVLATVCATGSVALHVVAKRHLRKLRE